MTFRLAARPPASCAECPIRTLTAYAPLALTDPSALKHLRHEIMAVPAKRILLREGEMLSKIFTLYDGWAIRFRLLPDGRRQILSFLLPGGLIYVRALLGFPANASVQALTNLTVCVHDQKTLADAMTNDLTMMKHLATRNLCSMDAAQDRILGLVGRSAMERVTGLIISLTRRIKAHTSIHGETFEFPLRQEHFADALGLTAVHVSRTLSILRDERVITLKHNTITIHDWQRLIQLCGDVTTGAAA